MSRHKSRTRETVAIHLDRETYHLAILRAGELAAETGRPHTVSDVIDAAARRALATDPPPPKAA